MSHNPYIVQFPDGSRLYGVLSNGSGVLLRPLFRSPEGYEFSREALFTMQRSRLRRLRQTLKSSSNQGEAWESENRASVIEVCGLLASASNERLAEESNSDHGLYGGIQWGDHRTFLRGKGEKISGKQET